MTTPTLEPMSILIVEDEAVIALDLEALLRGWGYEVIGIAASAERALELAEAREPDLVLLDIRLRGEMDGVDVGGVLQARWGVPLIFLTAYADSPTLKRAGVLKPVGYLLKPIDQPLLAATLELASHRRQLERERIELQANHRRIQALLSAFMEGCPEAMLAVDLDGRLVQMNQRACALSGHTLAEALGQSIEHLLDVPSSLLASYAHRSERYETRLLCRNGRTTPVDVAAAQVSFEDEKLFSLIVRDLSELQRQQEARDRLNRLQATGRLAAGVAHDLCGLLTTMKCSAALIRSRGDEGVAQEARQLDEAIARGSALLGNLLGFVRSGREEFRTVEVGALVSELHTVLKHAVGPRATLTLDLLPGVHVLGNESRLAQLVLNLVFNARDSIEPEGLVSIAVRRERVEQRRVLTRGVLSPGDYAVLEVVDNGEGIDRHVLPRVFDPFFSTRLEKQGSGLGLATVVDVLEEHEGHLDLQSWVRTGTTVRAYFPLFPTRGASGAVRRGAHEHTEPPQQAWRLLLVDDDTDSLRPITEWLQNEGHTVHVCASPGEALKRITGGPELDCVISDVLMPEMDGLSLRQRATRDGAATPFIYFTAYHRDVLSEMGIDLEGQDVLAKPLDGLLLTAMLERRARRAQEPEV